MSTASTDQHPRDPNPPDPNVILSARDIVRSYSPRPEDEVLKGLSVDIKAGDILAIVGSSGVGKTTFLNILGLLDLPTRGTVHYYGQEKSLHGENLITLSGVKKAHVRNRQLGFIFQLYHLLPDLTVLENVCLPALMNAGFNNWWSVKRDSATRARELLEEVGIGAKADANPTELSGGEKQRAAIARALIMRPEVVLCDEPTGNLDTATSEKIHRLLWGLNKEYGATMVIVTHDTELAGRAHRVLHMVDGRFVSEEEHRRSTQ